MLNEENDFLDQQENYKLPDQKEVVIDIAANKTLDTKDLSPIEMIRLTAQENGITLKPIEFKDGKYDTGCRRSGCYGRGYRSFTNGVPNPCVCLFYPSDRDDGKVQMNRKVNRDMEKMAKRNARNAILSRAETYGLTHFHKDVWMSKNKTKFAWSNIKGKWDFRPIKELKDMQKSLETVDE